MAFDKFWNKVEKTPSCWNWTASTAKGYGQYRLDKKRYYAHRFSWLIARGPIPDGMNVCHSCDTPLCVRPDHLFLGTAADNVADKISKGRARNGSSVGMDNGSAKLDEDGVRRIRQLYAKGFTVYQIAPQFGICKSSVSNIICKNTWRHVP